MGKASLNHRTFSSRTSQATGFGGGKASLNFHLSGQSGSGIGGRGGSRVGVGMWGGGGFEKASLNFNEITEQEGLEGGSVWARGVERLSESHLNYRIISSRESQAAGFRLGVGVGAWGGGGWERPH